MKSRQLNFTYYNLIINDISNEKRICCVAINKPGMNSINIHLPPGYDTYHFDDPWSNVKKRRQF